jgi:hypothetical protein
MSKSNDCGKESGQLNRVAMKSFFPTIVPVSSLAAIQIADATPHPEAVSLP